jgi:transcriptional regulator with XRE-family HTH domain
MIDGGVGASAVIWRTADGRSELGTEFLSVGEQVRRLRLAAGLTQQQLACRTGSSQPALAHIEAGRRTPTLSTLEKLARALGHDLVVVVPSQPQESPA